MNKENLVSAVTALESFIWDKGNRNIQKDWDNYSDEILSEVLYWTELDTDSLWIAYNEAISYANMIDADYVEKNDAFFIEN